MEQASGLLLPKAVAKKLSFEVATDADISDAERYKDLMHSLCMDLPYSIQLQSQPIIESLSNKGMDLDFVRWSDNGIKVWKKDLDSIYQRLQQLINIGSISVKCNDQIVARAKKCGINIESLSFQWLVNHKDDNEVIKLLLKKRNIDVFLNRFYYDLLPANKNGIVHLSGSWGGMSYSGRFAAKSMAMAALPLAMDDYYVAPPINGAKSVYLSADLKNIEVSIMASYSNCKLLVHQLKIGEDIHKYFASELFNVEVDEVTLSQRKTAKRVLYGCMYGAGDTTLHKIVLKAGELLEKSPTSVLNKNYPELMSALNRFRHSEHLYYGMKPIKVFPNNDDKFSKPSFKQNLPLQSSVGLLVKATLIILDGDVNVVNVVHDQIILHCLDSEQSEIKNLVTEAFTKAADLLDFKFPKNNFLKIQQLGA